MRLALAGDTMLGRGVAEALSSRPSPALFSAEVVEATRAADLCVLNLECCISERGAPWPARAFHFRAPPAAAEALADLGVDCVTLANNHALDFGPWALYRRAGMSRWSMERSGDRRAGARHHTEDLHCTPARSPALKMGNSARLGHLSEIRHKAITDVQKGERRLRPMGAHRRIRARRRP